MRAHSIHVNHQALEWAAELQVLIRSSPLAILALDQERKLRIWNAAAERIFGWPADAVLGEKAPFESKDGTGDFRILVENGLVGDELTGIELTLRRRDGGNAEVSVSVAPLKTNDHKVRGVVAIIADITERKRAEEHFARERNILLALMDYLPDLIFVKDNHHRFVAANVALLKHLGKLNPEEVIGRMESDFSSREIAEHSQAQEREIMRTGQASMDREELLIDAQGIARWFSTTRVPFDDPRDGLTGIIGLSRDITSRKQLETKLTAAQKLESIGFLAAGIAHEINTPIQYVSDNIAFLRESFQNLISILSEYQGVRPVHGSPHAAVRAGDLQADHSAAAETSDIDYVLKEIPKALEECGEGLQRVSTIVKAMKEFSHPGPAEMRAVDLNQAIRSTAEVSRNEWKYAAEMHLDLDSALGPVRCLPGELNQVVLNLIVNAAHAITDARDSQDQRGGEPAKGVITITTRRDGEWVEIRVQDTGTGIPQAVQPKVFLPFFTTKEVGKGTGQGLSIAHTVIVKKHGGTIRFETQEGQGTVFVVRIPFDGAAARRDDPGAA